MATDFVTLPMSFGEMWTTSSSFAVSKMSEDATVIPSHSDALDDIPNKEIARILAKVLQIITYCGGVFELFVILFLFTQFARRSKELFTAYFILNAVGYVIDFVTILSNYLNSTFYRNENGTPTTPLVMNVDSFVQWYATFYAGPWVTVMAANRLSAVLFWKNQDKIWTGFPFILIHSFTLAFPFVLNGYTLANFVCRINLFTGDPKIGARCGQYQNTWMHISSIANLFCAVISCACGLVTAFSGRLGLANRTFMCRYEKRLSVQSVVTSALFALYSVTSAFYSELFTTRFERTQYFWWHIALSTFTNTVWLVFHYFSMFMLIKASPPFRRGLFRFYGIQFMLTKMHIYSSISPRSSVFKPSSFHPRAAPKLMFQGKMP